MNNSSRIVVVGSHAPGILLRVKRIPVAGETVIGWDFQEPKDGGKGSNQAIAAALLGGSVSFVGCVGIDRIGEDGSRWMLEAGVDTTWLNKHPTASSGVGVTMLDEKGVPAMVTAMGANAELTRAQIENALHSLKGAKVLLTQFEIPPELALFAAEFAAEMGMITIVNPAPAPDMQITNLERVSVLLPNETEAQVLLGLQPGARHDPVKMVAALRERTGTRCVIITLGEKGAVGIDDEGTWMVEAPQVDVIDTSGAGDVFCAAFAVSLLDGQNVRSASRWACQVASLSVTKPGTIQSFPSIKEVEPFPY
jgi:ribokinase